MGGLRARDRHRHGDPLNDELRRVEHDAFHVESRGIEWRLAVVGMVVTAGPLAVGAAIDNASAGLNAALGGLNVGLALAGASLRRRAVRGTAVLASLVAVAWLATALHPSAPASVVATFVLTGVLALAAAGDRQDALVGFVIAAVFIIVNGLPGDPGDALARAAQLGAGGAVALVGFLLVLRDAAEPADRLPLLVAGRRAALAPGHPVRAHALRISVTTSLSTAAYRALDLSFGYWVPLTAMAVLQPDGHTSRVRAVQRATGTLVGTAAVAVVAAVTDQAWVTVVLVAGCAFGLFALRARSYHWLVTLLTPTVLLMISTLDVGGEQLAWRRVIYTAAGIALALAAAAVDRRGRPPHPSGV